MRHVLVPVKPFGVAKRRLSGRLSAGARTRLGRAIAAHTVDVTRSTGADVSVITPDDDVAAWCAQRHYSVIREPGSNGLDGATRHAIKQISGPWLILHADLPLLSGDVVADLLDDDGPVLAASHDGGSSAVGSVGSFEFSYGPGSFNRHLKTLGPDCRIVSSLALAIDLDDKLDLDVIRHHPAGSWIEPYLG